MEDGKLPNNEAKELKPVDVEDKNVREEGFASPPDDSKGFLDAYFDGPYERPFRKRDRTAVESPDGTTLGQLVAKHIKD